MKLFPRKLVDWRTIRARIINETGDYITECLRNPDLAVRIPAVPAEKATWTPEFSAAFWSSILYPGHAM